MIRCLFYLAACFSAWSTIATVLIDGQINEDEWAASTRFQFSNEVMPGYNVDSELITHVFLQHDAENLYVAFDAKGDPDKLRATVRPRDTAFMEDFVMIALDTFGDDRYAVVLGANAKGSQVDMKQTSDGGEDENWDILFESQASIYDQGYRVEFAIPFQQLQFPQQDRQEWKVAFGRVNFQSGTRTITASFKMDRAKQCLFCQTDKVYVIKGLTKELRRSFIPFAITDVQGSRPIDQLQFEEPDTSIGISALYDLNSTTSLEFTINPDFSQVEADVAQIDVNSTFAISYPEKRAFFLEGIDLIQASSSGYHGPPARPNTVYTRSINNPKYAAKLIKQGKNASWYALLASDSDSPYLIPGEERSYFGAGEESLVGILRYRRNLPNSSHIGALFAERNYDTGGRGSNLNLDGKISLPRDYIFQFDVGKSRTKEPEADWIASEDMFGTRSIKLDGESFGGQTIYAELSKASDHWMTHVRYRDVSPDYRADTGFITRNNIREYTVAQGYQYRSEGFFRNVSVFGSIGHRYNYDNEKKREQFGLNVMVIASKNIRGGFSTSYDAVEKYRDRVFDGQYSYSFFLNYAPIEQITLGASFGGGDAIGYNLAMPTVGDLTDYSLSIIYKPTDQIQINPSYRFASLSSKETGEPYFDGGIGRVSSSYQFNNDLSFRLIMEKNTFRDQYYLETLFKWNPNPFTIFYVGGSQYFGESSRKTVKLDTAQIYMKFQYYFLI